MQITTCNAHRRVRSNFLIAMLGGSEKKMPNNPYMFMIHLSQPNLTRLTCEVPNTNSGGEINPQNELYEFATFSPSAYTTATNPWPWKVMY